MFVCVCVLPQVGVNGTALLLLLLLLLLIPCCEYFVGISIFLQSHLENFHLILFISSTSTIHIFHLLIQLFGMLPNKFSTEYVMFLFRSYTLAVLVALLLFSLSLNFIWLFLCREKNRRGFGELKQNRLNIKPPPKIWQRSPVVSIKILN